jgi:hypothetical protein
MVAIVFNVKRTHQMIKASAARVMSAAIIGCPAHKIQRGKLHLVRAAVRARRARHHVEPLPAGKA